MQENSFLHASHYRSALSIVLAVCEQQATRTSECMGQDSLMLGLCAATMSVALMQQNPACNNVQ